MATSTPNCETPDEGADTIDWLGTASEPGSSGDRLARPRASPEAPRTVDQGAPSGRKRRWAECERISGWRDTRIPTVARSNR